MNVGDLVVKLRADLRNFTAGMTKATGLVKTFAARATVAFRNLAHTVTRWMRRIALVITATIAASIRELAKFEEQMANVSTMLTDQSMHLLPQYSREMRDMSIQFGESTATITKGMYDILSASVAPEKALGVLRVSMMAARGGMTDTASAAKIITDALNAYGFSAKYAMLVSDRLWSIVKRGKTTWAELASSMGMIMPNAALVGAKLEVVGAALSTATRSGVSFSTAVRDLNFLMLSFLKPTGDAAKIAAKYGVELKASSLAGDGLLDVLAKLNGQNERNLKASAEDLAAMSGRQSGMRALAIMLQKADEVQRDYNESLESAGTTMEKDRLVADNLMMKLRQFWQLLKDIMRSALEPFSDDLKALIDYTIAHRDAIIEWVSRVTGKLDEFVEYLQSGFAEGAKVGFEMLKEIARTTGEALKIIFEEVFTYIGANIPRWIAQGVKAAAAQFNALAEQTAQSIMGAVQTAFNRLRGRGRELTEFEKGLPTIENIEGTPVGIGEQVGPRLTALYAGLEQRLEALRTKHRQLAPEMQALVDHAKKIGKAFKDVYDGMRQGAETTLPEIGDLGGNALKEIGDAKDDLSTNMEEVTDKWKTMWADASGAIAGAMENAFADIVVDARNATQAIHGMLQSIQRAISQAVFQQYLLEPIFSAVNLIPGIGLKLPSGRTPGVRETQYQSGGGIVYAQAGTFRPRGTDSVPAMLTPGEGVLDAETTARLRKVLAVPEPAPAAARTVNFHVTALDAASVLQLFKRHGRELASVVGGQNQTNHPIRRATR